MKIQDVIVSESLTGFFFDDQKAIKAGAENDGFTYLGEVKTDKFTQIRQKGEAVSIQLVLENGMIAVGDAAAVQYSGAGGRDPLFLASDAITQLKETIIPELIGLDVSTFKANVKMIDHFEIDGHRLHSALRYGLSQALLDATAKANGLTIAEVIRKEYDIAKETYERIPIFAQSGDDRYSNVDKMIIKEVEVMPHALINNINQKLGYKGEILYHYVEWLRKRVLDLRVDKDYHPIFHIDVYGTIAIIFDDNVDKIVKYLLSLEEAAAPFTLRIEGPIDAGNRKDTMEALKAIKDGLEAHRSSIEIVADEWCNTLEDVKYFADHDACHMVQVKTPDLGGVNNIIEALNYCHERGIGAYSGGTCNETNISAEITTNIAIACDATQVLAKPGMGTDEGIMIVNNEMNRTLARIHHRKAKQ